MIDSCRLLDGKLQTPLLEFQHTLTRSKVSLIGAMHVAERGYYDEINKYIAERESAECEADRAKVYYEMVKDWPTDAAKSSRALSSFADSSTFLSIAVFRILHKGLGLVSQQRGVNQQPHWENHDMSLQEIAHGLGSASVRRDVKAQRMIGRALRLIPPFLCKPVAAFFMKEMADSAEEVWTPRQERTEKVIVYDRNVVALEALDRLHHIEPNRDAVLLWGDKHIPDLAEGLVDRGYLQSSERWLTVVTLPNYRDA